MKEIHIACGQFIAAPADKDKNIEKIVAQTAEAKSRGCSLIIFPEMALTGYIAPKELAPLAEPADGPNLAKIASAAKKTGMAILIGFPELSVKGGVRHNSYVLFSSGGEIKALYRKIHLWDTEAAWAEPGEQVETADIGGVCISGWICYDTRFPELARLCYFKGAELCAVPTAWLGPAEEWELALRARALDNAFFVAGADLINQVPGLECRGVSMIVDPFGTVLARAVPGAESIIDAVLYPERMKAQRDRLPIMRDRKPALYTPLTTD